MSYLGDIALGATIDCKFTTVATTGAPTTLAGSPAVSAYVDNGTTEITAGITLSVDFDGRTGLHNVRVVATSGNGFATATNVDLVLTAGTVSGVSVVGYVVGSFSIQNRGVAAAIAVWDRVLTAANHNISNSAGRRLRQLGAASITGGTAQAGASNSITLAAGESSTNEIYDNNLLVIVAGTGAGQARVIVEYNGTTKVAIVDQAWVTAPDNTSEYEMFADHQSDIIQHGLAQAGGATSITLSSTASATDDVYLGATVYLTTGTGSGQARLITDYDGATKVATVSPAWAVNPASNTVYKIIPFGRAIVDSISSTSSTAIADALLNRDMSAVSDTNARSPLNALRFIRNKWSTSGATLTVTKEDDSTTAWTSTVSTNASAEPIVGNDPA